MSFCQATSCFYFGDPSRSKGQEIIPSKDINQIIFKDPLSTVSQTLWKFQDPEDPVNKIYIAKFKPFGNFNEEPFQATLKGDLYHLDKKNLPENPTDGLITHKTATLLVVGGNKKCNSIFGMILHKPQ